MPQCSFENIYAPASVPDDTSNACRFSGWNSMGVALQPPSPPSPARLLSYAPCRGPPGTCLEVHLQISDRGLLEQSVNYIIALDTYFLQADTTSLTYNNLYKVVLLYTVPDVQEIECHLSLKLGIYDANHHLVTTISMGSFVVTGNTHEALKHSNHALLQHLHQNADEVVAPPLSSNSSSVPMSLSIIESQPEAREHWYNSGSNDTLAFLHPECDKIMIGTNHSICGGRGSDQQIFQPPGVSAAVMPGLPVQNSRIIPSTMTRVVPSSDMSTLRTPSSRQQTSNRRHQQALYNPCLGHSNRVILKIIGSLDGIGHSWSAAEYVTGRRVVEFKRRQSGKTITLKFRVVGEGHHKVQDAFYVSCIWWNDREEAFVTSVDTIHLLQCLTNIRFTVEEKNRIRRNLEGFQPLTVSKTRPDCESLFTLIMGFPEPKPRNIEKDVKIFPWRKLETAIRKIVGKYSASPASAVASSQPLHRTFAIDYQPFSCSSGSQSHSRAVSTLSGTPLPEKDK